MIRGSWKMADYRAAAEKEYNVLKHFVVPESSDISKENGNMSKGHKSQI